MSKQIIITPLGTVSPYCKGNLNCPGFLINYNDKKILLDCGNGTTRLLNFPNDLKDLSVFITHLHKDHFGDLGSIQYASYVYHNLGLLNDEVKVYLPEFEYLDNKSAIIQTPESFTKYYNINEVITYKVDDIRVSFQNNNSHTIPTYAIKLENDSFKIVYTSDVGNTNIDELVEFSKDSDLLICESSFVRSHNASSSTHLHSYESAMIGKKANVKQLMLTHFWTETSKIEYLEEAKEVFENTIVAEEGKQLVLMR
ncbi:MAG: MBL fold metallo-hydrolase [Bacilli bacterium]